MYFVIVQKIYLNYYIQYTLLIISILQNPEFFQGENDNITLRNRQPKKLELC